MNEEKIIEKNLNNKEEQPNLLFRFRMDKKMNEIFNAQFSQKKINIIPKVAIAGLCSIMLVSTFAVPRILKPKRNDIDQLIYELDGLEKEFDSFQIDETNLSDIDKLS